MVDDVLNIWRELANIGHILFHLIGGTEALRPLQPCSQGFEVNVVLEGDGDFLLAPVLGR